MREEQGEGEGVMKEREMGAGEKLEEGQRGGEGIKKDG